MSPVSKSPSTEPVERRAGTNGAAVTVVITTFERPDYLAECLASVADQTLEGFRLVVLDNASTADYAPVLERFSNLPMTYVRNEVNLGATGNIRKALRDYADTNYLIVFHDDDVMHPRMLEWQLAVLESDPEIQFVSTEFAPFEDGEIPPRVMWDRGYPQTEIFKNPADLASSLLGWASLCFGSTLYRSSTVHQVAPDDSRFSIMWDRPFLLDAAGLGKAAFIRAPLVLSRQHSRQDSNVGRLSAGNMIELMRAYREVLPQNWSPAEERMFFNYSGSLLLGYGYARLAPGERRGAFRYLRSVTKSGVLRYRDARPSHIATILRVDGWRVIPAAIDSARATKRRLASVRRRANV